MSLLLSHSMLVSRRSKLYWSKHSKAETAVTQSEGTVFAHKEPRKEVSWFILVTLNEKRTCNSSTPTYIAGSRLSCPDSRSSSTINLRNKVLVDRYEFMKSKWKSERQVVLSDLVKGAEK